MDADRRQRLGDFVAWVGKHITGDEKGQAQLYLDRLFQAFGQRGSLEVGGTPEFRIKKGREETGGTSFADYVWKPVVLIEMKKRGEDLARHRQQAFDYWIKLVPGRPVYTILCNFDEFWIYDFNVDLDDPLDKVTLAELPERYDPLAFLFPTAEKPVFQNNRVEVTRAAADALATAFFHMTHVRKVERGLAQRFILQMLVALFAEDIDLLPKNFVTNLLADIRTPEDSYDLLGGLFEAMNRAGGTPAGRFKGIRYFNGGLFREPARLALDKDGIELAHLRAAARENWSKVSPDIFGTLFQHSMDAGERHAFGAHYTAPMDIMKIVKPTIVDPWTELIESARTPKKLADLLERLALLKVLDPACGSGNFLYIAYRELKRLETRVRVRLRDEFPTFQATLHHVTARQFFGIDILPFAIELAKVTMMIARKLAIDELHIGDEPPLPLDNLDANFRCGDALLNGTGAAAWPAAHVIIGNPPFLDARKMTKELGRDYVRRLEESYPDIPRRADHCTYWFRRAHEHLPECTAERPEVGRAGLVGTQNIRNNQSRVGGLDHIVKTGVIVEAVDNQPWSGEANVHVSIANWVKGKVGKDGPKLLVPGKKKLWFKTDSRLPLFQQKSGHLLTVTTTGKRGKALTAKSYELDFRESTSINSALSDAVDVSSATILDCNRLPKKCFEGQQPGHKGFRLSREELSRIPPKDIGCIVFQYVNGDDLLSGNMQSNPEYIIDFGDCDILAASGHPEALELVRKRVLPKWQENALVERKEIGLTSGEHQNRMQTWWCLKRRRGELLRAIAPYKRYVACSRVTKRPIFAFVSTSIHPDSSLSCFAFDDDYSFGILQSSAHWLWFTTKCSKLTERFRYTPESVFDTFPWPQSPTKKQVEAVASAGREVRRIRAEALAKMSGGLRGLYRTLELPGKNPLKEAHAALDAAVLAAYGFKAGEDLLGQLLGLNQRVAAAIEAGQKVTGPGVPAGYGDAEGLVSADCIGA